MFIYTILTFHMHLSHVPLLTNKDSHALYLNVFIYEAVPLGISRIADSQVIKLCNPRVSATCTQFLYIDLTFGTIFCLWWIKQKHAIFAIVYRTTINAEFPMATDVNKSPHRTRSSSSFLNSRPISTTFPRDDEEVKFTSQKEKKRFETIIDYLI